MDEKTALTEVRYIEQRLSEVMGDVLGRVIDEDVREGLQRVAMDHSRQAGEATAALMAIGETDARPPDGFRAHVSALEREILHATDNDGLFNGLADAERLNLALHEHLLDEAFPAQVHGMIEKQTGLEREHMDFLESRAPGMSATVHGVGAVPKRGTVE